MFGVGETLLLVIGVIFAIVAGFKLMGAARRRSLLKGTFTDEQVAILDKQFPRYSSLPEEIKAKLQGYTKLLIHEKYFEACGDLPKVTDEMKLVISTQAALLLVGLKKHHFYSRLKSILVYPGAFRDEGRRRFGIHDEERGTLLGESWGTGSVILSWESVVAGARNSDDGMNVTIHEFAHQLDQADGAADGVPILGSRDAYQQWSEVFQSDYEELVEEVNRRRGPEPFLDPYGATNPAEFFAVASETFFEAPNDLVEEHPELYDQLKIYYGLDPVSWPEM